ncbi:MAG: serine protease [Blastomonas sp.]
MARKNRRGCVPWILGLMLLAVWLDNGEDDWTGAPGVEAEQFDPRSPRRPMPQLPGESFLIEDSGPQQDSQGTAFAIDSDGVWMTAEHVTHDCDRLGIVRDGEVELVGRVLESSEADAALVRDGPRSAIILPIAPDAPENGEYGYHMGFPGGSPAVVLSRFMGAASARRGARGDQYEPIFAWAEEGRSPPSSGSLGGISGGPTLDQAGRVIGINSASTPRRGRVLTTDPSAMLRLVAASRDVDETATPVALPGMQDAVQRFRALVASGVIRQVYCDVQ